MPTRFAVLAQWYELTWGNVVDTRSALHERRREAGLEVAEETSFSRRNSAWRSRPSSGSSPNKAVAGAPSYFHRDP